VHHRSDLAVDRIYHSKRYLSLTALFNGINTVLAQLNQVQITTNTNKHTHKLNLTKLKGTHVDERTVLYRTKSLDGTKLNTNPNPNPNTNPIQWVYAFFEHRPLIFSLSS